MVLVSVGRESFIKWLCGALQDEQKQLDQNTFKIPLLKIEQVGITDSKKNILLNLHNRKIIVVSRKVIEPSTIYQPNGQRSFSRLETITDNSEIVNDPNTDITLVQPHFDYLSLRLLEIIKQYETSKKTSNNLQGEKPEWQDDFHWEGSKYVFGEYGFIVFNSLERKTMFKKMTEAKGGWVKITELKGGKDEDYVRATISQIEKRIKIPLKKYISIPSTKDDDAEGKPEGQGAYRIKFSSRP